MDVVKDDFYVYLDSITNKNEYQANKPSGFTNIVNPPLILPGHYDVALENIIFKKNIYAIRQGDKRWMIKLEINIYQNDEVTLADRRYEEYFPQVNMTGDTIEELIKNLNWDFMSFLKKNDVIDANHDDIFILHNSNAPITFNKIIPLNIGDGNARIRWSLGRKLCKSLGIQRCKFIDYPFSIGIPKLPNPIDYINVYCDRIEPSYYGGQRVHLLDIVPMNTLFSKGSILTMYKRINTNHIDDISIKLTSQNGEDIIFGEEVKVLIVLHFKRVE